MTDREAERLEQWIVKQCDKELAEYDPDSPDHERNTREEVIDGAV